MTESDWWTQIVRFTREGDWNGFLVAADGFQELGREDIADGLRWVVRAGVRPTERNWVWYVRLQFGVTPLIQSFTDGEAGIRRMWEWVIATRKTAISYFLPETPVEVPAKPFKPARREERIGPFTLRYDGEEVLSHELGDELIWQCPVTGSMFHMERMQDNYFWFRIDARTAPDAPETSINCGVYQPDEGRLQLLVEED